MAVDAQSAAARTFSSRYRLVSSIRGRASESDFCTMLGRRGFVLKLSTRHTIGQRPPRDKDSGARPAGGKRTRDERPLFSMRPIWW